MMDFQWVNTLVLALFLKRCLIKEHQFQGIHLHGTFRITNLCLKCRYDRTFK